MTTTEILDSVSSVGVPIFISVIFVYIMINNNNKYLETIQNGSDYKDILNSLDETNENISRTLELMQKEIGTLEKITTTLINSQNEIQRNTSVNNHKIEKIYTEVKIMEQYLLDYIKLQTENEMKFNQWKSKTIVDVSETSKEEMEDIDYE